jgi:hypothetical protein
VEVKKMSTLRFSVRILCVCVLLLLNLNPAAAQEVKLDGVPFQQVLDRLFGTTSDPGLLAGKQRFELRAEDVTLTADQARNFLVPSSTNKADIADLVTAAEQIRGAQVKIEGLVDGSPFELKLAGKEFKLEGLNLTQAQLDSLVEQLKGIQGLREAKIESLVNGKPVEIKIENRAGRVKVEDRERHAEGHHEADEDHERRGEGSKNSGKGSRVEVSDRHVERLEKIERPEKNERVERPEKVERIERPETEHGGPGRH